MGIRKQFSEGIGRTISIEDERNRFVNRINQMIFSTIDTARREDFNYEALFHTFCFVLGVDPNSFRWREQHPYLDTLPPEMKTLTKSDFYCTLEVLCILYVYIEQDGEKEAGQEFLSKWIEFAFTECACDIGVRWKDGLFYPSGAKELDKPLIDDTLIWLKDFPRDEKDYRKALEDYAKEDAGSDVVKNCYNALEGVVREVLGNKKALDKNRDELLARLKLSDGWKRLLGCYITYAHDYRHASKERHNITPQETEAYLYMTGVIILLFIVADKSDSE